MKVPGGRPHELETWLLKGTQTLKDLQGQDQRTKGSKKPPQLEQLGVQGLQ